jgi:drug/metabolite transporter superfamily protein YnfA
MSSTVPKWPSGVCFLIWSWSSSGRSLVSSVMMNPGATALAVIPRLATSRATAFVRPIRPAFEDE